MSRTTLDNPVRPRVSGNLGALAATAERRHPGDRPKPPAPFTGIDRWPVIDLVFREASTKLAKTDLCDWALAGGVLGLDGLETFASPSATALRLLSANIESAGCFRYREPTTGMQWAVRIAEDRGDAWRGWAISPGPRADVLAATARFALLQQAREVLADVKRPGQVQTEKLLRTRARMARLVRSLDGLDLALDVAAAEYGRACVNGPSTQIDALALARRRWGRCQVTWPDDWQHVVFDGLATLAKVEVQIVDFRKTGWRSESVARQPAIIHTRWIDSENIEVAWSKMFLELLSIWLGANKSAA